MVGFPLLAYPPRQKRLDGRLVFDDVIGEFSELFVYEYGCEGSSRILWVIRRTKSS